MGGAINTSRSVAVVTDAYTRGIASLPAGATSLQSEAYQSYLKTRLTAVQAYSAAVWKYGVSSTQAADAKATLTALDKGIPAELQRVKNGPPPKEEPKAMIGPPVADTFEKPEPTECAPQAQKQEQRGFFSHLWSGIKKFEIGPSSEFGHYVAHGKYSGSDFVQNEARMQRLQRDEAIATVAAVVAVGTGGKAAPHIASLASSVGISGTANTLMVGSGSMVVSGATYRGTSGTLRGESFKQVMHAAFNPQAMVVDASIGMALAGVGVLFGGVAVKATKGAAVAKSEAATPAAKPLSQWGAQMRSNAAGGEGRRA